MLSHTYHDPISHLHPIFEFAKKISNFIFYAYFLKDYFKAPVQKLFSAKRRDFFQKIKINVYVSQNLILTNETLLKLMILNKFSFGSFRFGGRNAKFAQNAKVYWFSLRPFCIASLQWNANKNRKNLHLRKLKLKK